METVNMEDFKKEKRKRERKERVTNGVNKIANWCDKNKETLAIALPVLGAGITGTTKIVKSISRNAALKQEKKLKERFVYDRSLGKYLELKKPLNNHQLKTILERKDNGEKLSTILQSMKLLK